MKFNKGFADWILIAVLALVLGGAVFYGNPTDADGDGVYDPTALEQGLTKAHDVSSAIPGLEVFAGILGLGVAGLQTWRKNKGKIDAKNTIGILVQSIDTAKEVLSEDEKIALHNKLREVMPDKVKDAVRLARRLE